MQQAAIRIPLEVRTGPNSTTVICDGLGYIIVQKTPEAAHEALRDVLAVDPMLASVPADKKRASISLDQAEVCLDFSPEFFGAMVAKIIRRSNRH